MQLRSERFEVLRRNFGEEGIDIMGCKSCGELAMARSTSDIGTNAKCRLY
jgi:hypothetical protein